MPMYDYKCCSCGEKFEELVISSEINDKEITCPYCNENDALRQLSAPVIAASSPFEPATYEKPICSTPNNNGFG